jgi:preprotein translocase subunit SecG
VVVVVIVVVVVVVLVVVVVVLWLWLLQPDTRDGMGTSWEYLNQAIGHPLT